MKTVKEVSVLTGISVRTLHYYDEIGLLKPSACSEAGYRRYDDRALERLQQILFFREFDIPLKDIKSIMERPDFDREKMLAGQRKILVHKRERLEGLIRLLDDVLKGENTMSFCEFNKDEMEKMFYAVVDGMGEGQIDVVKQEYGDMEHFKDDFMRNAAGEEAQKNFKKLVDWYGGKDAVMDVAAHPNSTLLMQSLQDRVGQIYQEITSYKGEDVDSFQIKKLVGELDFVSKQVYQMDNVDKLLRELAAAYMENPDFIRANDGQYGTGASEFIGKAILHFYKD